MCGPHFHAGYGRQRYATAARVRESRRESKGSAMLSLLGATRSNKENAVVVFQCTVTRSLGAPRALSRRHADCCVAVHRYTLIKYSKVVLCSLLCSPLCSFRTEHSVSTHVFRAVRLVVRTYRLNAAPRLISQVNLRARRRL